MNSSIVLPLLAMGLLAVACDPSTEAEPPDHHLTAHDGEDLFRGIVLGYGPVAELVPEVRDHFALSNFVETPEQQAEVEIRFDALVDAIAEDQPDFFPGFARDMRSGDPQVIEAALANAKAIAHDTAQQTPLLVRSDIAAADAAPQSAVAQLLVTTNTIAFTVEYIHHWIYVTENPPRVIVAAIAPFAGATDSRILHEQLVQRIASEAEPEEH